MITRARVSQDMQAEILRRLSVGETKTDIAKSMNLSMRAVLKHTPRLNLSRDQVQEIVRLIESGSTIHDVALQFSRSRQQISVYTKHLRTTRYISKEKKEEARRRIECGGELASIARDLSISRTQVNILADDIHRNLKISRDIEAEILKCKRDGKSVAEIATGIGVPRRVVKEILNINPQRRFNNEQRELVLKAIEAGLGVGAAAKKIGASRSAASVWFNSALQRGTVQPIQKTIAKSDDFEFSWITRKNPALEEWRSLVVRWLKDKKPKFSIVMSTMVVFIERFLIALDLPKRPADLLRRGQTIPDFYLTACPKSTRGCDYSRTLYEFIEWILDSEEFSDIGDDGIVRLSNLYTNPVSPSPNSGADHRALESGKIVMTYYLISDLRKRIVQGPNFRDWTWVQGLNGRETINGQQLAGDWFTVTEDKIRRGDPDCVWRLRQRLSAPPVLEMWSPVRWVLQLIHLQTTTRVGQARMVDSGEADTWVYDNGQFNLNTGPLKQGTARRPHQQGVFRRPSAHDLAMGAKVYLYFNSNKTADQNKSGADKGFVCAWPCMKSLDEDPYYWLAKLRDWQTTYNPIDRLTAWTEIKGDRKLSAQSLEQLAEYPETAFLFRTPENPGEAGPIGTGASKDAWRKLLTSYEGILLSEGIRHPSGNRIELINPENGWPWSSPHSTRVSLITHMILDGNVPVELMTKIVGHARLIMTVYYTKVGLTRIQDAIQGAAEKLDAVKYETFERDLLNTEAERMRDKVVFGAADWKSVLPVNPADRTPLGWLHLHDGICLAGGNADIESLPGCHNGGPILVGSPSNKKARYGPVPGGVRNCCRCRWKCAGKVHVPAMVATLNNRSYHLHCASTKAIEAERKRNEILQHKAHTEAEGRPYTRTKELIDVERKYESAMLLMQQLALDVVQINAQIERIIVMPDHVDGRMTLAAQCDNLTLHTIFADTDSELLMLAGICADVELYPDLDPGTAVFKLAQLLDQAFEREGQPLTLARLSQEEKLICSNAIMRELERHANPNNHIEARHRVVEIIDREASLESILGIKLKEILKLRDHSNVRAVSMLFGSDREGHNEDRA